MPPKILSRSAPPSSGAFSFFGILSVSTGRRSTESADVGQGQDVEDLAKWKKSRVNGSLILEAYFWGAAERTRRRLYTPVER